MDFGVHMEKFSWTFNLADSENKNCGEEATTEFSKDHDFHAMYGYLNYRILSRQLISISGNDAW